MEKKGGIIGIVILLLSFLFLFLLVPQAALAQEGTWSHSSPTWAITYIHSGGSWNNVSQDHSHSYTGKNLSEVNIRDTKKQKSFYAMTIENMSNFIFA
jgi:carbonic anhydrase